MEFGLSQEQILLQDSVNRYLTDHASLDKVRQVATGDSTDAEIWKGLVELGIAGLLVPEAKGGVELTPLDAVVVAECLGYHTTPAPFLGSAVMVPLVLAAAGKKDDILGALAAGEHRTGIAFGEAVAAREKATIDATGNKLNGKSLFALDTDANDYLVATADKKIYLVAADAKGLSRRNLTTVDKTRTTCELVYKDTPAELITEDPEIFTRALDTGRVMLAADTLGAAQCMLDQAVAYAKERKQFNRVIGSFQAVKHMCAEMVSNLEPCRSMVWYAAYALQEVPEEARLMSCHSKALLSEVGKFVSKTATEVHGGMGFTDLVGLHFWFKRIGFNRQLLGSPEMLREEAARIQGLAA